MADNKIKIGADVGAARKSIMDLSKELGRIKDPKVSIFDDATKKLLKSELKSQVKDLKEAFMSNKKVISSMVAEAGKLTKNSKEELEIRKKIIDAYKEQSKITREMGEVSEKVGKLGGVDGILSKLGGLKGLLGGAAGLVLGYGAVRTTQATSQYVGGVGNRNRLEGLGVDSNSMGSNAQLSRVGLTQQEMIERRIQATSVLGSKGTSSSNELEKAAFERSYGLQGGTMTNVAGALRGQQGGEAANNTQMKLQASIVASGLSDALGPYLETMTSLLSDINSNGTTQTGDLIGLMASMSKLGGRSPEQLAKTFSGVNSAVENSSGESNAFFQSAFGKAGIGGGSIGGTNYALSSGGIFGMDENELQKRGYNKDLLAKMGNQGMFSNSQKRMGAILDSVKGQAGMKQGQNFSDITDPTQMYGVNAFANQAFGTKGNGGMDSLLTLEQARKGSITSQQAQDKLKSIQEGNDPVVGRLDKINSTMSGQTEILTKMNNNLMEGLGIKGAVGRNAAVDLDNKGIQHTTNVVGAITDSGAIQKTSRGIDKAIDVVDNGVGDVAGSAYQKMSGMFQGSRTEMAVRRQAMRNRAHENGGTTPSESNGDSVLADKIGASVAKNLAKMPPAAVQNNVNVSTGDHAIPEKVAH